MPTRPFRFALSVNRLPESKDDWLRSVKLADDLGYSQVVLGDHVGEQRYSSVPALAAAAAMNPRLRFGTSVFNNDFRHPALLAKDVATLDVMTEGRYELGLGAGWMGTDYTTTGIPRDSGRIRIERLEESVQIIKGLFGPGPVSFEGRHYQTRALEGWPKPIQQPLPIFIGGGTRRLLAMAARQADIVGLQPVHRGGVYGGGSELSSAALAERQRWVAEAAGERIELIELQMLVHAVSVTGDPREGAGKLAPRFGMTVDEALTSPYLMVGPITKIVEDLISMRERLRLSYFTIRYLDAVAFAPVLARLIGI
ncbi:MAG: TIGR03621 family F420-dependent LLM class oxidoreductase [Acidimicrobiia bacterium]